MATSDSPLNVPNVTLAVARGASGGGSGATPMFFDDFETGDLSKSENGFSWTSAPGGKVTLTTNRSNGGTHSLQFVMSAVADGVDTSAEQRFEIGDTPGQGLAEVWFEYDFYVPSNYKHRDQSSSKQHKFFALFADEYNSNPQVVMELQRETDTESSFRVACIGGEDGGLGFCDVLDAYYNGSVITPAEIGTWMQVRLHMKTGPERTGMIEAWFNGVLKYRRSDGFGLGANGDGYFREGYVFGYSNAGFDEETVFNVDNFKVYDTDPGWV